MTCYITDTSKSEKAWKGITRNWLRNAFTYVTLRANGILLQRKADTMYSDLIEFLKSLPEHVMDYETLLPESLVEHIPIDSIKSMTTQLTDSMKIVGVIITLILALLACFLGYKLARLFMTITGFFGGLALGYAVSSQVLKLTGWPVAGCMLAGGILMALLAYRIYVAGIFILCFVLAFIAAAALLGGYTYHIGEAGAEVVVMLVAIIIDSLDDHNIGGF